MSPKNTGLLLFVREVLSRPAAMGAAFPTSTHSSKIIACSVPQEAPGLIVELGAGTGVISQELLNAGIDPKRLILVENSPSFYKLLIKRFPMLKVINGDAANLEQLLGAQATQVSTIVSGIPLRSLPPEIGSAIGRQIEKILRPNGTYIQLTYSWSKYHASIPKSLRYNHSKYLWLNIPPGRIDIFNHVV